MLIILEIVVMLIILEIVDVVMFIILEIVDVVMLIILEIVDVVMLIILEIVDVVIIGIMVQTITIIHKVSIIAKKAILLMLDQLMLMETIIAIIQTEMFVNYLH